MPLLGDAALMIWCDVPSAHLFEHSAWHSAEHLPERMAVPGFLRARRAVLPGRRKAGLFILYELRDLSVMTTLAYLERLNAPTARTRRLGPDVLSFNRSPGRVVTSWGRGAGGVLVTVRLGGAGMNSQLILRAGKRLVSGLRRDERLIGGHFFQIDPGVVVPTSEQRLRGRPDATAEFAIVLEGFLAASLRDVWTECAATLAPLRLDIRARHYVCAHIVCADAGLAPANL